MTFKVKRVYDPTSKADGERVLVDRLWPRGISKAKAKITVWAKDLTPSNELRSWFHADPERRFKDFQKKYAKELSANKKVLRQLILKFQKNTTLITAVKDIEHSHIPTLLKFLRRS